MRENESDSEGGRPPHEDLIPWAPRDEGEDDQASGIGAQQPSPPGIGDQETIAFGVPGGDDDQGSYVQRGGDDVWYGGDRDQAGYGGRGNRRRPHVQRAPGVAAASGCT